MAGDAQKYLRVTENIAREISAPLAAEVDRDARFPREAFDALKAEGVLSAGIPLHLGGGGLDTLELGRLCTSLSRHCASTSMILGMHFIKLGSIVHYAMGSEPWEQYLRDLVEQQRLIASMTSEVGIGGNLRSSVAAVAHARGRITVEKESTCLSYVEYADDILITCRRDQDAAASDQVVVLAQKGDYEVTVTGEWDAMGMRGTCSPPCRVQVDAPEWQVFDRPFAEIAARTMVPETHILWSHVWLGIAEDAVRRARAQVRSKTRKNPSDSSSPAALRLARLQGQLQLMRDNVAAVAATYVRLHAADDSESIGGMDFMIRINELKINSSELVRDIAAGAMEICGFTGYLNNSEYTVTRHLRDAYSAAAMIGNDRLIATNALLSLMRKSG